MNGRVVKEDLGRLDEAWGQSDGSAQA